MYLNNKFLLILLFSINIYKFGLCDIIYRGHPILNDPWEADSLFVGSGFIVKDSTVDINVIWKVTDTYPYRFGELHFMVPGFTDSSIFLFHNIRDSFPEEPDTINLGKFPSGTQLVFMYKVIDAAGDRPEFENKRLFSGQNRESIDDYISEMTMDTVLPGAYSRRWLEAGKIDDTRVEGGFEDGYNASFRSIIFEVNNVYLEVHEKYKTSRPKASPTSQDFENPLSVSLEVPYKGNRKVVDSDTIDNRPDSTAFFIYYTTDGSTPSISDGTLYTEPIEIAETTTLKAIAVLEGDTNWFDSEVMEVTYTYTGTANKINIPEKSFIANNRFPVNTPVSIYNPRGRVLFTSQNPSQINNFIKNNSGVYIVKYVNKGKAVVRKVLFAE